MKRSELGFTLLLIPLDILAMVTAFSLAYATRIKSGIIYVWDFGTFLRFVLGFVPFWLILFGLEGLYRIKSSRRLIDEFAKVILGVSSAVMLMVIWIFLSRTEFFSRLVVVYGLLYGIILVFLLRLILRQVQRYLLRYDIGVHRVAVIGQNGVASSLINNVMSDHSLGFKIMKIVSREGIANFLKPAFVSQIDEVILADTTLPENQVLDLIEFCERRRIVFRMVPNLFKMHTINIDVSDIHGVPLIELRKSPLDGWWRVLKRVFDFTVALIGLILSLPVLIAASIAIKLTSPGPIIYRNKRVGAQGSFYALKLRSMYIEYCTGDEYGGLQAQKLEQQLIKQGNTRGGGIYKIKEDPRVTPLGIFLRRFSIDELPQLINVLRGEMSLVGPRPHQSREVKHFESDYQKLLHVKPGLTGLAQISGRSDLSTEDEVKLETFYVENWSLWLDVKILLRTPLALFSKRQVA